MSVIKRELAHQIPVVRRYVAHTSRRWAELLEQPDRTTLAQRARARFSDHHPGWPISVFHSADVQIAAAAVDAVRAGRLPHRHR